MAFDGVVIANLVSELNSTILGGRISKIAQPEKDEILLTIKGNDRPVRLLLSANASLPLLYLTSQNKPSPLTAPSFCMLLRKHILGGRIMSIEQPDMERIVIFSIEHLNEMGDLCQKKLIIEIMGKHSNIIFCDEDLTILDSIKHISANISSVREVLPGRSYFIPKTQDKKNPLLVSEEAFCSIIQGKPLSIGKAIYTSFTGISPMIAAELCTRSHMDSDAPVSSFQESALFHLAHQFRLFCEEILAGQFSPCMIKSGREPVEFSAVPLLLYPDCIHVSYNSISAVLEDYYAQKNTYTHIRQKTADLRRIVTTALERTRKKYDLQQKQLKDCDKRETYRVYGELLHTYGYGLAEGAKSITVPNYYTGEELTIPLDPTMTAAENAKKYFDRYSKQKRTFEALTVLTSETHDEILHLESVATSLDLAVAEADLTQIREELVACGYIRKKRTDRKATGKSKPFHYLSSDGFHIYVGKNNYQNDELTFRFASNSDWWFHAKGIPGSHVIVKAEGKELPDRCFEEAARLAAYYSKGRGSEKVEIDYVERKHIKKPNSSKPGFVVYYTNYSLSIDTDISGLTLIEE